MTNIFFKSIIVHIFLLILSHFFKIKPARDKVINFRIIFKFDKN